jgi:hypothetical protein
MVSMRRRKLIPGSGLHQCIVCHDDFVVPVWAKATEDGRCHLLLRCAQCETFHEIIVARDVVAAYALDLQRGIDEIQAALCEIDLGRMRAQADLFAAALALDLIDAADFAQEG